MLSKLSLLFFCGITLSLICMGSAQGQGEWGGARDSQSDHQGHPGQWDNYGNPPWNNNQNSHSMDHSYHSHAAATASTWSLNNFVVMAAMLLLCIFQNTNV
ncbi:uncharacterized protein LOC131997264 [Stomoxys calcitrans]|uniref:uncharacterized protein LOC131997264 n=1 Tax=Stomoxys calcitrans TaxID=35570 RepID=UPI0027E35132|nr:uncharacterized protein LOC131997264 [Stomoxys calcitrans]